MKKIRIVFGTYNSQPLGTADKDFENAYQKAYKPFLTTLYNLPEVFLTLHYSGILLQWIEDHHPEFLMLLNDMVKRKQIELLGGAFFEPILPLIPMADRIGQIEALTTYLRKRFGRRPRGCWVPEKVWEPALASMFSASGMDFVFLDDWHFRSANMPDQSLYAPCYTEDQGKLIAVYPICTEFLQVLRRKSPEEAVESLLRHRSEEEDRTIVIMEDGSNFGLTGDNHERCYKDGMLHRFLSCILEQKDTLKFINPARFIKYTKPERKAYFSCTSYEQMMDWLVPFEPRSNGYDAKGSHFRQFLTRYPESNLMYSKMLYTNILVNQIRGDKYRKKAAKEELWKGQCNNAYWFGRCGGIYSNHLRKSVYGSLLEAEKTTHEKGLFIPSIITTDFDMDGKVEYLYQGFDMNAYVHVRGGMLFELDFLPANWNYLDTMSRYREDDDEPSSSAPFDRYLRRGFIDHIFHSDDGIEAFQSMRYRELGNFVDGIYEVHDFNREKNSLDLFRIGQVSADGIRLPLHLQKKYVFKKTGIDIRYVLKNPGDSTLSLIFGSELNLSLGDPEAGCAVLIAEGEDGRGSELGSKPCAEGNAHAVTVKDRLNAVNLCLSSTKPFDLWSLPIHTAVKSPNGLERQYQASCMLPRWSIHLPPGGSWDTKLSINMGKE